MRWLAFMVFLLQGACTDSPQQVQKSFTAFGSQVHVTLIDNDPQRLQQALKLIQEDLDYMHSRWHAWSGNNPVSRVNGLLRMQGEFSAPPSLLPMIQYSKQVYRQSGGLFNPALGELFNLWHFQGDNLTHQIPPDAQAIQALIGNPPTMDHIKVEGIRLQGSHPRIKLDFGAIGKGYGLGQIMQHLRQISIQHAKIDAGGDVMVIGKQQNRPWQVNIRHPRQHDAILAQLELGDQEGLFTATDSARYFMHQGLRYHHILDPRTGAPARGTHLVSVIHTDPALADAAATALFIAGPTQWREIAEAMGIIYVLLVDEHGQLHMTEAMQKRLLLMNKPGQDS